MNNAVNPYTAALQKFNAARANLLLAILFTAVNILLLLAGQNLFMLFSFTVPYFTFALGQEIYTEVRITSVFVFFIVVSVVILGVYLLFWILSKKNPAWLIGALVLFGLDFLFLIYLCIFGDFFSNIMDLFFHAWILYYLISGVCQIGKLKNPPPAPAVQMVTSETAEEPVSETTDEPTEPKDEDNL